MAEEALENETPTNEDEETPETPTEEDETPETTSEEVDELKKKADLADNYKIRAEKAEKKLKDSKEETPPPAPQEQEKRLSDDDLIYLAKADIHSDDLKEVREYAEKNSKTMEEAHGYLKPIFDNKAEERKSAEATNTKRSPRGTTEPKGDQLLADANRGKLPDEEDSKGIDALVQAEANAKKPKGE